MSTELQQPFGLTPSGGVAIVGDPGTQAQQHLQSLVSTGPGERVMLPQYGVPVTSYVFGLDADQVTAQVSNDVGAAIRTWEPSIALQNVQTMVSDTSRGVVSIDVLYAPGAGVSPQAQTSIATVLVGGGVVS